MNGTPIAPDPWTRRRRARARAAAALALALFALVGLNAANAAADALSTSRLASLGQPAVAPSAAGCVESTFTSVVQADSWVDENSPQATKGSDSILNVDGGSLNVDTGEPSGRARALLLFQLPGAIPDECVLESARLHVFSTEESAGARAAAARLASTWSEDTVSWSNQPATRGDAVAIWSRDGYMQWNVTAHVEAMLVEGNYGFVIRDAAEATEAAGGHGFYAREKGENPARLVLHFAPPPSDEPPGPPEPPEPAAVACGQTLTKSTLVSNDLLECPGDGLVIGAPRIIVDLGGHTIDGVGLGSGVLNDGYASVTVRNGTVRQFDYGVNLLPETKLNLIESMTLLGNEVGAVELFDVRGTEVRGNVLDGNGGGISLVSGTSGSIVAGNTVTANGKAALFVRDSDHNRLEDNSVSGGGDLGIGLERASGNALIGNDVAENSDGGIELRAGSHGNRIEGNVVMSSGDHGILIDESDGNEVISNTSHFMSDSGITLETANDGVVRGNDARFNTGGIQVDGSSRNVIEANDASGTTGIGIEFGGGSLENLVAANVSSGNGASGILVADDAADPLGIPIPGLGNLIVGNVADDNEGDGILVPKGGHTITANFARDNAGLGVLAAINNIDGGLNVARGNLKPEQCTGVVCKVEWNPPETTITDRPADATSGTSAGFGFTGSDDTTSPSGLRFECRLDSAQEAAWAACSSPRTYTGLATGAHVFEVRAIDDADNVDPTPARHAWTIDASPPETSILEGPDVETASTAASFVFLADEPGATFACSLDGGPFVSCASPTLYAVVSEGPHEFRVFATDAAGNSDSTPASHVWSVDATAPETTIAEEPDDLTKDTSAAFSFSADEDGASFACSLDGAPFDPCESPVGYTGLADGAHSFEVRASDRLGNADTTPARHAWTVDTVAPETTMDSAPADPSDDASSSFAFSSEAGATYECRLDEGDWAACESPQGYSGLADGPHQFHVRASDRVGNTDASPASYSWTVDTVAPETTIDSGPPALTNGTEASFAFSSEPGASFECRLDRHDWAGCSSPLEYATLPDGAHSFEVRAADAAGNADGSPASHAWTIDTVAPETTIDSAPAVASNDASPALGFSSEPGASFDCRLDGGDWADCSSPQEYTALPDGAHSFEVRAADAAGNADGSPASYAWTIDTVAPETTIDSAPAVASNEASPAFGFSSEPGASFECRLDGGDWADCSSPQGYAALPDGGHSFDVRASDAAGNVDGTPAAHSWTVDTIAPETAIDSAPAALTNSAQATFAFSAEPGAGLQCRLDQGDWQSCESPQSYAALADGAHSFDVRANDAAGNVDGTPAAHSWTVDTIAPETAIDSAPAALTNSAQATFAFSAEPGAGFQCRLDQGDWQSCESPQSYAALADGAHSFDVRANDAAGNVDATPAAHSWTIDTIAPETTIDSGPPATTEARSASLVFSASEAASTFTCSLDGGPFAACTSPQGYTDLAPGLHRFHAQARDQAGNVEPEAAAYEWTIFAPDTTAPDTAITTGPTDPSNSASTGFSFTGSDDETAPSALRFECRLDSVSPDGFASCSSPHSRSGLADGSHTFEVRAVDEEGNTDLTPASYTWTIDTVTPQTTISSGPAELTNSTSASFAFAAAEAGSSFQCRLDEGAWQSCESPKGHSALADGAHRFQVRASDAAGNVEASPPSYSWTVDTIAPETTISSGPAALTNSTSASFAFSAGEAGSSFQCSLDGAAYAACTSPSAYSGLAAGAHSFQVRATDPAGNTDPTPASRSWTIDTAAPQTTIDSAPAALTNGTSATFVFSAGEPGSSFQCSLDGGAFAACTSPSVYSGLAAGAHSFQVRATDPAGNTDPTPASHSWTIDTTAPQTTIASGPPPTTQSTSAGFTFSASEAGSSFQCSLDGAAFVACTSPSAYSGLAPGAHGFQVRATDPAGNTDPTPASQTWTITASGSCAASTVTLGADADSWVLQSSATSNYAKDSVLKVDTKAGADARTLVRFPLPPIPAGCQVTDARLRLYASSYKTGRTLQALRLAAAWTEIGVTWSNQPATAGTAATVASGEGYREWSAVSQVQAMYASGNHGFLVRDASEGGAGWEQGFHSREKGTDNPPRLVITFGASSRALAMREVSSWADRRLIPGQQNRARKGHPTRRSLKLWSRHITPPKPS